MTLWKCAMGTVSCRDGWFGKLRRQIFFSSLNFPFHSQTEKVDGLGSTKCSLVEATRSPPALLKWMNTTFAMRISINDGKRKWYLRIDLLSNLTRLNWILVLIAFSCLYFYRYTMCHEVSRSSAIGLAPSCHALSIFNHLNYRFSFETLDWTRLWLATHWRNLWKRKWFNKECSVILFSVNLNLTFYFVNSL